MSSEFEVSILGGIGTFRYKKVCKVPAILEPCKHIMTDEGTLFKYKLVTHCDINGKTHIAKIKV